MNPCWQGRSVFVVGGDSCRRFAAFLLFAATNRRQESPPTIPIVKNGLALPLLVRQLHCRTRKGVAVQLPPQRGPFISHTKLNRSRDGIRFPQPFAGQRAGNSTLPDSSASTPDAATLPLLNAKSVARPPAAPKNTAIRPSTNADKPIPGGGIFVAILPQERPAATCADGAEKRPFLPLSDL
jgi:hypothetical protein